MWGSLIKYYLKRGIENIPWLYIFLLKLRYRNHWFYNRIISSATDIMIEGFPRSANSFAVMAFRIAHNHNIRIATHTHSHAHVLMAVRKKIPCLVLIRPPAEAVVSLKALYYESSLRGNKTDKNLPLSLLLRWYITFYKALLPHQNHIIIATFDEVVNNFTRVMQRVNARYNTSFTLFEHNDENVRKIFAESRFHLSPSEERERIKRNIVKELKSDRNQMLLQEANEIYRLFTSASS